jgi:predicted TPR repeat methyltransferase
MKHRSNANKLKQLHDLGTALHASGELDRALEVCEQILKLTPRDAYAHVNRSMLLLQLGKPKEALAAVDRAIKLLPRLAEAHNQRGQILRKMEREQDALNAYARALQLKPDYADALLSQGLILQARGDTTLALKAFEQACKHKPDNSVAHYNRGIVLWKLGRGEEAVPAFQRAIQCDPGALRNYHSLIVALGSLGLTEGALQVSQAAVRLAPDSAEARCDLAMSLWQLARHDEALAVLDHAIAIEPDCELAHEKRGELLVELGRMEEGRLALTAALKLNPRSTTAQYLLASLGTNEVPDQSPRDYVVGLFDAYAGRFDRHLVEQLNYQGPGKLYESIRSHLPPNVETDKLAILDLGCGTGLCGEIFAPLSRKLVGVDLSPVMLIKARQRDLYNELIQGDICEVLEDLDSRFDLIIAGDVFVYIGNLSRVLALASKRIEPNGLLAFSVESHDEGEDYLLGTTGRYSHKPSYLRRLAIEHDMTILVDEPATLRYQNRVPVSSRILVLRTRQP